MLSHFWVFNLTSEDDLRATGSWDVRSVLKEVSDLIYKQGNWDWCLVGLAKNHTFNDNSKLEFNFTHSQKYSFHLSKFENIYINNSVPQNEKKIYIYI